MRITARRRVDVLAIGAASLVAAGVAAIGAVAYDEERISRMWVGAQLDADESAAIHEVIDYDFGNASDRHGLLRIIPGLSPSSPFRVDSPDGAPDGISSMSPSGDGLQIRVGDATKTVSGRHRYILDYRLEPSVLAADAPRFAWDAIGTLWTVAIEEADVELAAPFELTEVRCSFGSAGSHDGCGEVERPAPGRLHVHVGKVPKGKGVTIELTPGPALAAAPALPSPPADPPDDPGAGIAEPTALAAVAALGAAFSTSRLVRRAGRERVGIGAGGATDAAFAMGDSEQLVDGADLADLATTEFAPPADLTPSMGGIVLREGLKAEHKVAWLIEAAIAGAVDLREEGGKTVRIDRLAPGDPSTAPLLDRMFGGRTSIALGSYDSTFASGWSELGTALEQWERSSGLWDRRAHRRKVVVRVLGVLADVVGLAGVGIGAALAARFSPGYLVLSTLGALVFGIGAAAVIRGWELEVRTPLGSGQYLRVESFRRFLHDSEAHHAEEAAQRGVLREYTAWAVALGEVDRWRKAVESSTVIPESAGLGYVHLAPMLASGTSHASTAPSSSGSGGGGGGVGGGGGGGGGGSW